jgi:ADP-glucose pyrophosphorylase
VKESVLFEGVQVEEGAIVHNSIVGPGAVIRKNAIVGDFSVLGAGCVIGEDEVVLNQKVRTVATLSAKN